MPLNQTHPKRNVDEFATGGSGGVSGISWPVFRWSGGREDKYFARIGKNVIAVYETETFTLVDKKSIKLFLWRPRPPSLLTAEKEEEIAKNLKKYSNKYEAEDQDVSMQLNDEQDRKKRKMLQDQWNEWVAKSGSSGMKKRDNSGYS